MKDGTDVPRPVIEITEDDFGPDAGAARALARGERVLGPVSALADAVVRAALRKVERLSPENFDLVEARIELELSGTVFGSGISGTIEGTFRPRAMVERA